jgi:hypothetical protein
MATVSWLICKSCGLPFQQDEGEQYGTVIGCGELACAVTYSEPPYDWSPDNGFCLICWLVYPAIPDLRERAEFGTFESN